MAANVDKPSLAGFETASLFLLISKRKVIS